jgi:propionyl-CoA carboxylase alpha chain
VWRGTVDGRPVSVLVRAILNGYELAHRGIAAAVHVYTKREAELAALMPVKLAANMSKFLLCPMPGLIKSVAVEKGQAVKAGDTLAVVEAMKMENVLKAERDGTVKNVRAKAGESLAVDAVILEFA